MGKEGLAEIRMDEVQVDEVQVDRGLVDEVQVDEVQVDGGLVDEVQVDEVQVDGVRLDEVQVDHPDPGTVTAADNVHNVGETAERQRSAVSLYVTAFAVTATASFAWVSYSDGMSLSWALLAFVILAAVADVREVRLPGVGVVGMSFVPVLAALVVLGLWPAMVVAVVSGATSAGFTRDPQKIVFNIGNYVLSTFVAGIVYVALVPAGAGFIEMVVPAFLATALDFLANTVALAGVIALSTGDGPLVVWRKNYQWALPGYLTGATFALLAVWLYGLLGIAGLVLAVPPVVLIYYSYEIYVSRARDRVTFDAERDSFHEELSKSTQLHEELRSAQLKVAAEIERARRIQSDLLPTSIPHAEGLQLAQRLAVYDPQRHSLAIAGGGHNPILVAGSGGVRQVPSRGAALGVRTGLQYPEDQVELAAGDTVALYTDGLTEARDPSGELFGLERLENALERCHQRPLDETLASVWSDVDAFRAATSPGDDATLLLARLA